MELRGRGGGGGGGRMIITVYCDLCGRIKGSAHAINAVWSSACCMTNIVRTISVIPHAKISRAI